MNPALARIDDRLIHGQVLFGCCEALDAKRVLLCSDEVAADERQRKILLATVPEPVTGEVLGVANMVERMHQLRTAGELSSAVLVTPGPAEMVALVEGGAPLEVVTVGGMHARDDRPDELWEDFYVGPAECEAFEALLGLGIRVQLQRVPGAECRDLTEVWHPDGPKKD